MSKKPWQEICPTAKYAFRIHYVYIKGKQYVEGVIKNKAGEIIKKFKEEYHNANDDSWNKVHSQIYEFFESLPDLTWGSKEPQQIYFYDEYFMIDANTKF